MSKMSTIYLEIQEYLDQGHEPEIIAKIMEVPIDWVLVVEANMEMHSDTYEYN